MIRAAGLVEAVCVWAAVGVLIAGCTTETAPQPTPEPPDQSVVAEPASVAGKLAVQAGNDGVAVFEQEPNNRTDQAQFVAHASSGEHYLVFGSVSANDPMDAFAFDAAAKVRVSFTLSFSKTGTSGANDFDLGYYDGVYRNCYPGNTASATFTRCFASSDEPETGSFDAQGSFVVAVVPFRGRGEYQLDIAFSTSAAASLPDGADTNPLKVVEEVAPPLVPDEVIVRFDPAATAGDRERALVACGLTMIEESPSGFCRTRRLDNKATDTAQRKASTVTTARRMAGQKAVLSATPNYIRKPALAPNDEHYNLQWHYAMINLPEAWDITTGGDDTIVAVVDTGILAGHPDIQGRLTAGYDFVSDAAGARDGDGRDSNPNDEGDWLGGPGHSSFHGTHVSGTIAATTNNGTGAAGVTWKTRIMPVRALGVGGGADFDVAEAVRYAAGLSNIAGQLPARPARIINLSVSGGAGVPASDVVHAAIQAATAANALVVVAAGNENSAQPSYPGAFSEVLGVGAVDIRQQRAWYSNYGNWISMVAPGGDLGADVNGDGWADGVLSLGASDQGNQVKYQYRFENGTSMAAPHVCGVAALVLAVNPNLGVAELRDILQISAKDLGAPGRDDEFGYGLLDAAAAVREAQRRSGAAATDTPRMTLSLRSLDFNSSLNETAVGVSNTGGGVLNVTKVTAEAIDGAGWLRAAAQGSAANSNVAQVRVTVDRAGLANGSYRGRVTVEADGLAAQAIDVRMSVGIGELPNELIFVLAVDPSSLRTVASGTTSAENDFAYRIDNLAPGTYALYAGTDRDSDGIICEVGDLCGALPSTIDPTILDLAAGQSYIGADFPIALQVIQSQGVAPASLSRLGP